MTKKFFKIILKVVVSTAVLYLLFGGVDKALFWDKVVSVSPFYFVGTGLVLLALQCISTYRWSLLVKGDIAIRYRSLLSIYCVGMFFNSFLPTAIGGDFVKGYYLFKKSGNAAASFASIFVDRYSGFAAMIFIEAVAIIVGYGVIYRIGGAGLLFFFVLLVLSFVLVSLFIWVEFLHGWLVSIFMKIHFYKINDKIDSFYKVFISYKGKGILVRTFLVSLVIQSGVSLSFYVLGLGLGIDVPAGYYFMFVPMANIAAMIPLSLAGLGIREGVFIFLFAGVGVTSEEALALSLLWFVMTVVASLPGAVEYVRMKDRDDTLAVSGE